MSIKKANMIPVCISQALKIEVENCHHGRQGGMNSILVACTPRFPLVPVKRRVYKDEQENATFPYEGRLSV